MIFGTKNDNLKIDTFLFSWTIKLFQEEIPSFLMLFVPSFTFFTKIVLNLRCQTVLNDVVMMVNTNKAVLASSSVPQILWDLSIEELLSFLAAIFELDWKCFIEIFKF